MEESNTQQEEESHISSDPEWSEIVKAGKEEEDDEVFEQTAQKIIHALNYLDATDARRGLWELVQNAVDTIPKESDDKISLQIECTENELIFKHDGPPFGKKALGRLVRQFSNKSFGDLKDGVGQNGTGFLTTHSFGRVINIYGSLVFEGRNFSLNPFTIDRSFEVPKELAREISSKYTLVFDLMKQQEPTSEVSEWTAFHYQIQTDSQWEAVKLAMGEFHKMIPYVMLFSGKIRQVRVSSVDQQEVAYERRKKASGTASIYRNDEKLPITMTGNEACQICVPVNENNEVTKAFIALPKLFFFYPMIGTEAFGLNLLIHHPDFKIPEKRNELITNKEGDLNANRQCLEDAFSLFKTWLTTHVESLSNRHLLASVTISKQVSLGAEDTETSEPFAEQHKQWVNFLRDQPLVKTGREDDAHAKPSEVTFLHEELVNVENATEDYLTALYHVIRKLDDEIILPVEKITGEWTGIVNKWGADQVQWYRAEDLFSKLSGKHLDNFDMNHLRQLYEVVAKSSYDEISDPFQEYALLPNYSGHFKQANDLVSPQYITAPLLAIAVNFKLDILKQYIHQEFKEIKELSGSHRKDLYDAFKKEFEDLLKEEISIEHIRDIHQLCRINLRTGSDSFSLKISNLIGEQFDLKNDYLSEEYRQSETQKGTDNYFNYNETPVSNLINFTIRFFTYKYGENDTVAEIDRDFLIRFITTCEKDASIGKERIDGKRIFINQKDQLKKHSDLSKGLHFEEGSEDEARRIEKSDYLLNLLEKIDPDEADKRKSILLHHQLHDSKIIQQITRAKDVAESITDLLYQSGKEESANQVSSEKQSTVIISIKHKELVMKILETFTKYEDFANLFEKISRDRAQLLTSFLDNAEVKVSMFNILRTGDEKINALAQLVKVNNIDKVIEFGMKALEQKNRDDADFRIKHEIGKHIENKVREKLTTELEGFKVFITEEQNGQDIIIYQNSEEVYYIEVKSRWSPDRSVTMSKNQSEKAAKHPGIFALCYVELIGETFEDYLKKPIMQYVDKICFLPCIGEDIKPIVEKNIVNSNSEENLKLQGYELVVSQEYIQSLKEKESDERPKRIFNFEDFVTYLVDTLKLHTNVSRN